MWWTRSSLKAEFQSTLPVWGATLGRGVSLSLDVFQSTLPVWGATNNGGGPTHGEEHFNPRSPCGERLPPLCGPTLT